MEHFLARPPSWEQIQDERYLCGALRNLQAERRREEARLRRRVGKLLSVTLEGAPLQAPSAEECAATAEDLDATLHHLCEDPRVLLVFRLVEVEGLTAEQAGIRMGLSRHQVNRLIKTPAYQAILAKYIPDVAPDTDEPRAKTPQLDRTASKARRPRKSSALVMAIITLSMALIPMQVGRELGRGPMAIVTGTTEHEAVTLDDGSTVQVAPDTVMSVDFRPTQRVVRLTSGQATFDVTSNVRRPFIVRAQTMEVKAIGTRFMVRCDEDGCQASVMEGIVEVRVHDAMGRGPIVMLQTGQRFFVSKKRIGDGLASTVFRENEDEWVFFSEVTVGDAVAEFNRRHAIQIRIDSPAIAATPIGTARLRLESVESFTRWLTHVTGATLVRSSNGELIVTSGAQSDDQSRSQEAGTR